MSCRALSIDKNKVWFAANNGKYGYVALDSAPNFTGSIAKENLKLEFRSIAQTSKYIFILSVANPGLLYRIAKDGTETKLVYEEKNEKVFYDSMQFFNDMEGIAVGDPTEDCPSIIKTFDGGKTWQKLPCTNLPKFADGEAFFAASNTNLIIRKDEIWMVSGGKKSKVYHSNDKGNTWTAFETPIVQGQNMTGAFCADFYDENIGIIAGGNYEKLNQNFQNKALTNDGGKTWKLIAENKAFGYASCVQFFPNSGGKSIIAVGATGVYFTRNGGKKWQQLALDKDFLTIRFVDSKTAIAAGKDRIVKITFK
jgi:photosystem II stability/assembly factor-like uncharacterized protein